MWIAQCFSISLGTLFVFGTIAASFAIVFTIGCAANSYTTPIKPTQYSIDYLLERFETIKAADYAVKDEITRFIKYACESDEERIRVLDYLIERNDSISETANLIKENLYEKE